MGLAILIAAIILNYLANTLNIMTWYSFIEELKQGRGIKNFISGIFLFIIYPLILGLVAYFAMKLLN